MCLAWSIGPEHFGTSTYLPICASLITSSQAGPFSVIVTQPLTMLFKMVWPKRLHYPVRYHGLYGTGSECAVITLGY